ncbi:MAG: DUF1592 domain-containing protein [Verrucomicrobia bacterium]|nr:DUF1592 domain-containing protein [Verrucomicrobiota bacterium]
MACALGLYSFPARAALFGPSKSGKVSYEKEVKPLMAKYCYSCHGAEKKKGDLDLHIYTDGASAAKDRKTWEKVLTNVRISEMPPSGKPQPSLAERETIQRWIEQAVFLVDCEHPDPGRVTIRRLNRAEYNNTIRDLLGVDFEPAADFPADDAGYGFDNIGDVLSVPPVLLEKYLAAAEKILDKAIVVPAAPKPRVTRYEGRTLEGPRSTNTASAMRFVTQGEAALKFTATTPGEHAFLINTASRKVGDDWAQVEVRLDGQPLKTFTVTGSLDSFSLIEVKATLKPGEHRLSLALLNPFTSPPDTNSRKRDRGFAVEYVELISPPDANAPLVKRFPVDTLDVGYNARRRGDGWVALNSIEEDDAAVDYWVQISGEYALRVRGYGRPDGDTPMRVAFMLDKTVLKEIEVADTGLDNAKIYEVKTNLPSGKNRLRVVVRRDKTGLSPEEASKWKTGQNQKGTVYVNFLEISGPTDGKGELPDSHTRVFAAGANAANKQAAARAILANFTRRAYRRPVSDDEVTRLMRFVDLARKNGDSFEMGIKLALEAVLVSPHFLFRGELQPEPNNPKSVHPINEFTLASRLSYFLWSSMPDEELFTEAQRGTLRKNLEKQVQRMLADSKSCALVDNFAGQWLQLRNLRLMMPDKDTYPDWDESLRPAMQRETELLFNYIMREDRSVLEFLTADYTFVNERLAKHYGMAGVNGERFQKVSLRGTPRVGVLTHASILTLTSNPTRTSPVKRGKWVLENILGTPPPPPPPNVPELKEGKELAGTLRQRMEQHRENPMCASCHTRMDAIGFGFENFDGIGAWRVKDGGDVIDPSGQLSGGDAFKGPADLVVLLSKKKQDEFLRCLSEKMLTYG